MRGRATALRARAPDQLVCASTTTYYLLLTTYYLLLTTYLVCASTRVPAAQTAGEGPHSLRQSDVDHVLRHLAQSGDTAHVAQLIGAGANVRRLAFALFALHLGHTFH